eukprot:scaffold74749_cov35-Cyclotella_meneghiniana.AAC.8
MEKDELSGYEGGQTQACESSALDSSAALETSVTSAAASLATAPPALPTSTQASVAADQNNVTSATAPPAPSISTQASVTSASESSALDSSALDSSTQASVTSDKVNESSATAPPAPSTSNSNARPESLKIDPALLKIPSLDIENLKKMASVPNSNRNPIVWYKNGETNTIEEVVELSIHTSNSCNLEDWYTTRNSTDEKKMYRAIRHPYLLHNYIHSKVANDAIPIEHNWVVRMDRIYQITLGDELVLRRHEIMQRPVRSKWEYNEVNYLAEVLHGIP